MKIPELSVLQFDTIFNLIFSGYNGSTYESPPRCLTHAFTIHTKYELAPPYPQFSPKVFLKLDGVVILNTGDSLIAISVDIEDNHGGFGFGLYSPRVVRTMSSISSISSPSEDQMSGDSHDRVISDPEREHLDLLSGYIPTSPNATLTLYRNVPTPKDTTNIHILSELRPPSQQTLLREKLGKENQNVLESVLNRNMGSPPQSSSSEIIASSPNSRQSETPNSKVNR